MASTEVLRAVMDAPRNGCNGYFRHPLVNSFIYTDGVKEVAELAGCYWLLDLIAAEAHPIYAKAYDTDQCGTGEVHVKVHDGSARVSLSLDDTGPDAWSRKTPTDFPDGDWVFLLSRDDLLDTGRRVTVMYLLAEN